MQHPVTIWTVILPCRSAG